jgi:hypothetical protein
MSKKNKIYWSLGVTEKETRALLTDENSKLKWLRYQKNRRVLVVLEVLGIVLVALGSYYTSIKSALNPSGSTEIIVFSLAVILVIMLTLGAYSLLRIAARGIADAPNELLDERQIQIRDSSYRLAYLVMGYLILGLFLLMFYGPDLRLFESEGNDGSFIVIATLFGFASLPSMFIAWREKDI